MTSRLMGRHSNHCAATADPRFLYHLMFELSLAPFSTRPNYLDWSHYMIIHPKMFSARSFWTRPTRWPTTHRTRCVASSRSSPTTSGSASSATTSPRSFRLCRAGENQIWLKYFGFKIKLIVFGWIFNFCVETFKAVFVPRVQYPRQNCPCSYDLHSIMLKKMASWAVVVAQSKEWSLPTPEVRCSDTISDIME